MPIFSYRSLLQRSACTLDTKHEPSQNMPWSWKDLCWKLKTWKLWMWYHCTWVVWETEAQTHLCQKTRLHFSAHFIQPQVEICLPNSKPWGWSYLVFRSWLANTQKYFRSAMNPPSHTKTACPWASKKLRTHCKTWSDILHLQQKLTTFW